jgi:hypothetical protein
MGTQNGSALERFLVIKKKKKKKLKRGIPINDGSGMSIPVLRTGTYSHLKLSTETSIFGMQVLMFP